jgi:probable phosphoglycerate mutase
MLPLRPFYFLRHGETDYNRAGLLQGWLDIPLNTTGEAQAAAVRVAAAGLGLRSIAVSSLSRARRTAEIVNQDLGLPVTALESLREFDVGPYQASTNGAWIPDWLAGRPVPGPEGFDDFCRRIVAGLITALSLEPEVLVVAHGGVFWALQRVLGHETSADIANCAIARFDPPVGAADGKPQPWQIKLV